MTTLTAVVGALPIALGLGAGAELRQPLGIAVVGGLIVSQFVTLIITPVIYLYLDKYSGTGPMEIPAEMLKKWDCGCVFFVEFLLSFIFLLLVITVLN